MTKQNLIKRFFARFMRARAASAAPAFLFAAAAAGFALAPLDASAARISESDETETGSYGTDTDQSLAVGTGNITIGGGVSVNVTETTLLTGTQLTISSTSETLDFGNVTFQQPIASDSITVSGENVSVEFDKVAAGTGYGKIDVADGAALVIDGDANLSAITAENGTLTVKGKATVETLTAKTGATVTLEADDASGDDASGVNSLVMAGGTVNVKNFTLDNVDGTNEDNNNASGTISSSGTLTVNTGTTLTTEALNLDAKENAVIDLKNGSEIDLGSGTVSLGANARLNIGDDEGAADLTAASLTANETATTTLNGGTLELNGAGITQNLDSLAETSTGTVSVSGEGATAVFSADKTFEGDAASGEVLDIAVANGTLQVDAVVSTTGTVTAKNLTIGEARTSVKAAAFELSPEGTLTMNGGTLDLSATNGATTNIYAIAEGSSGTITEGDTAGTIALNTSSAGLGELDFTAASGTVALTGTADAPITVETAGDVNAQNLVVGANTLVGATVTVGKATDRTAGDGLTLNGGTLTGTTNVTVNKVVEENLSGTVDGGTVIFDLDQKNIAGETVVAGTLNLGSEATNTNKVWIRGEGLTLGERSVVTATGDGVNADNGTATGLVVGGGAAGTATVFDLSATGTKLNVNAVNVYSADELKLSGDQKIGIGDKDGKIWLGVAATDEAAGKISTTGTLTSLGQTTMNGGRIESSASSPTPAPEQPEEGVFYPEATIHLGNVAMGNGVISAVNGSVKVADVRDQGIIAAKDISVGSVSDDDTDKVILAGSEDGATAAGKLTFTGTTTASNISANADSVVNTKALELADGVNVTIGSITNADILNKENLASVALGGGASLNTTSEDLSALTSVALATGTADDRTTWTHSSGIAVNGDVSVGNDASIDAAGAVSVNGTVSVGNRSDITADSIDFGGADLKIGGTATLTSETGDVTLGGVAGLDEGVLATATVNSAKDIVFAANSTSSLHLKATGDIVVNDGVSVTLSQGEIDAGNTTLKDGSTFELLGNNNVLGGTTGTPEENPYDLSEVTLGNDATLVIGGNNPADETEFYETFAKAASVKNASAGAAGTIEVNGKLAADETAEDKVSVFTAGTVGDATNGDATNGGVNVTLNDGGELVATGADAAGVGIYAAALNGTGGKLTAQAADGTKNDIYVTASNTVGENIVFTADELRVTDLDVTDGADVAVRLENADLGGVESLVVADAGTSADPAAAHTTLTLAGTSSVAAVTVGKDGNNGTLIVESLPAAEGEEPAAPVVVIGDLAADETANFQTGSLTLDGGALVATGGSIDVRDALVARPSGTLDGTIEAANVRVDLSAQTAEFGADLTLKGETVTLDGNDSGFALGSVVEAGKLVIGSDAEGETTVVNVADPATTLDGVATEIAVENGDSLIVESAWAPEQDCLTVTLDTNASLGVDGALTVGAGKSFAVNAAEDENGNIAEPAGAVFDEIVNNGNFSLENVDANTSSWTDANGATLKIAGTNTEERSASLDISGAAGGTTTFNSTVSLTNGALAVAQGNVALNGAVVSENGTVDVEAGDLTANDTVSLTDSEVTANGDVALNDAISSENGAITATTGSMTVSGGAGTIKSLGLTAGADITFDTTEFNAGGKVTVNAASGAGNVTFDTNVSLGAGSSVAAGTLTVNAGAAGTINGTVDAETIVLAGESAPDAGDAASLTISGKGNSTFATLTDAAGTTLSLTNGAALTQNGDATTASVSLNGTLSVADANSAFITPGSLTLANKAKLTLANGAAANIAGTLDLSVSTTGAVTVAGDAAGTNSDATTTLTAGTLVINPADAANTATQGVVSLTNGGQFTVGELAPGSTVTLTGQTGSGNIWVDETSHFTLKKGDIAITESTRGEIVAESGNVTFGHDAGGNGVYSLAGIGTQGLDLSVNSGHNEVNFTMSESLNADGSKTYSKVDVRGMMNLQGTDVSATSTEDQAFEVSVASGVNLDNANLTLENVAFSGGKSVSLTGSSELSATNTTIDGFDAIITTVGANNSSITLNNATLNTDVTMNSGTLNVGSEGATIGAGHTVSVNENVSAKLEGSLTGEGKLALNGGNVSLTGAEVTLDNVVVNAANAKISGGETLTIGGLVIGKGDALTVDAALSASGAWDIDGGSLTAGTLTIADGANVALTNSKLNGDIAFADGADAELSLTESTVDGNVTLSGENNTLYVTDSAIEGTLAAEAGEIHFDGENSFGGLDLTGDVGVFGTIAVKGKLEVDGGFNLAGSSSLSTTEGLFVNGGTATLAGEVVAGDVTLTGTDADSTLSGTIKTNLTLNNAQLSSSGTVKGDTTLKNGSALTQTDGTLGAVSVSDSTFTQESAGTAGAVTLTNGASATLAGTVASLDATNATANVSGKVSGDMTLTNATAEVSGTVDGITTLTNGSTLTQTAGTLGAVSVDASTFTQNAGTAGAVTLTNDAFATLAGTVDSLVATNASANVSGTVSGDMTLTNGSALTQTGGSLGAVSADASTFTQEAGTAGAVTLTNGAFATLAGTVSGDMTLANATAEVSGEVVGSTTLATGSALTQTAGTLGAVSVDASTFTQDAGTAGAVTLTNGAFATLAGTVASLDATNASAEVSGTVSGAVSLDASTLTAVDGITISDTLTAENNSIVNGDIMLDGAADVSLSGSTVNGDIAFAESANGADLKLIESTVAGNVTLSGESNSLRVENSSITGALTATAGTITFDGENSFGDLQLSGDVNVAGDITVNGALNAEGGFNLAGSSNLSTTEGLFVNGGTATLAGTVTQGDVTLTGTIEGSTLSGTIETNLTLDNAQLSSSGTVEGDTTLANDSALTQTDGSLGAVSVDASTFTQNAGTAGAVTLTNDAFATLAGTVDSLVATNATAEVSGTVSGDMTLTNATAEVYGTVNGDTTLETGSTLTQTDGSLGAVSVDASTFTQNAGTATAGAVTLTNGASATLAGTVASLDATNASANVSGTVSGDMTLTNATANVSGTVSGAVSLDASTLKAQGDKTFASLSLKNDSTLVSTDDITVAGAITDASGSISGANIALNGGLTGSASVSASGDLTLGGTTETSGMLTAKNGTLTVADGGTLTATDAQVEAGTLAVNEGATLNLTIEDDALDVGTLSIDGTANLTAANALTLSNLSGAGTANKAGAGALTLSGNGAFTGALNIGAGNASLSGAFGGSIGFASEGGTITGAHGASVAGTLTLAQGTTLEIGDASGAANLTVGKLALSEATARTAGTAKVVHDVFADGTDTLTITDATANLSGLTAVVRSNIDEELLGVGGQTITLVEGDVAAGYGFIEGIGFDRTNAVLSEDGKSLQVMLNWKAAADGLAGSLFNDNQRAVAAATKSWDASTNKYAQALSTLSTTETAAALDDLGALHTVAMMPGQIDGTWNHQKSVLNAIGTGSQMGYQFGKPDVNMGAWVQYVGSYNDVDSSSDRLGWDRTMNGATAGFEYAVSENFLAGVALGYEYAELKSDGNKIEDDAFSVDFFAKHRSGDFEQRAALTFAHHGYDTNRTIAFGGVAESVSGDTDGFTAAIAYEAAYNFAVKEYLTLAPVATLRAALNTIDGWSESGSDAALKFDDQSAFTALAGIGGRAEFAFANPSYPREALRLSAYALFTAEFGDRSSDVDASFVRGGNAFTMTYDDPEPYALQLGLTAFAPLTNRTALFGGISTELRDEESGFNANIGVRIGW